MLRRFALNLRCMNYFLKNPATQAIEGPYTVETIKAKLSEGALDYEWLATSDLGETLEELQMLPTRDWTVLRQLPDIACEIQGASAPAQEANYVVRPIEKRVLRAILFGVSHLGLSMALGFMAFAAAWGSALSDADHGESMAGNLFAYVVMLLQAPIALVHLILVKTSSTQTGLDVSSMLMLATLWSFIVGVIFSQLTRKTRIS
jgi:hypothetical protein